MRLPGFGRSGSKRDGTDPFRIGLVALAAVVVLGAVVTVLSTVSLGTKTYQAHLAQTAGLRVGESVQVAGVDSGEVTGIELNGDDVLVTFELDRGIHLGKDSTAAVKVATLLGSHLLAVDPKGSGELADDTVPLKQTSVPFNLQDVIDRGTGALDTIDSDLLGQALSTVADTLRASGPEFLPALQGVDRISKVVSQRSDEFGRLLDSARRVTDQLSDSSGDLVSLMKQTNLVVQELLSRRAAIHRLLLDVADLSVALSGTIHDTAADIGPALANLDKVLDILRAHDKDLRTALKQVGVGARYLANATGNGPWAELLFPGSADDLYCLQNGGECR